MLCERCRGWVTEVDTMLAILDTCRAPVDIDQANKEWGANCGPCALAAAIGKDLADVREALPGFSVRKYMNVTQMKDALKVLKVQHRFAAGYGDGLLHIQWGGFEILPTWVQYEHTHWIAVKGDAVFEVSAGEWVTFEEWKRVMPAAMKENVTGCNGKWSVRSRLELGPRRRVRAIDQEMRDKWGL